MSVEIADRMAALSRAIEVLQDERARLAEQLDGDLVTRCRTMKGRRMTIEAIKTWRNERGTTLKEAKDAVESL